MQKLSDAFFPDIDIEQQDDGLIKLTQFSDQENISVEIHPVHLRFLAEKFGLIETSDPQAAKTIATLKRRMQVLKSRIQHLDHWLNVYSDDKHADLSYEQTYATATAEIAEEFCAEFEDSDPLEAIPAPTAKPMPKASAESMPPKHPLHATTEQQVQPVSGVTPPIGKPPVKSQSRLI